MPSDQPGAAGAALDKPSSAGTQAIGVLIADDHPLFLEAVRTRIERLLPHARVLEAASLDAVLALAADGAGIRIILLDYNMPGMAGASGVAKVIDAFPNTAVAIMSGVARADDVHAVVQAGARGYLPKTMEAAHFATAINALLDGMSYVPADVVRELTAGRDAAPSAASDPAQAFEALSPREREVLACLAGGLSNKEIGRRLTLAEVTVKLHVRQILRKIDARNRSEAAALATRAGMTPPE